MKKPSWIKVKLPQDPGYFATLRLLRELKLHTVCEEAKCPNIGECWAQGSATMMIMGEICTRSCGFCAVETGKPLALDKQEPERVAQALQKLKLKHVV
ncbi:MAG: lipoyl synthase, partial [Deltaproteobacteria bacterium]|nr:lipoyl synthase [Deltaproteobacteria bacterium]